jgi:hypothetical protein
VGNVWASAGSQLGKQGGLLQAPQSICRLLPPDRCPALAWIRELVDTQWEILRHLRYRTTAIELSNQNWINERRKWIDKVLQEPRDEIRKLLPHCDSEIVRNRVAR